MSRSHLLALMLVVVAAALRAPGLAHDFWLDEVWSYLLVQEVVATPLEILTRLHIDNNHPLNSLFLYALGGEMSPWVYRLPSLAFGIASVVVGWTIMKRRGAAHALAAALLLSCSYPLVVYSSEARGYAAMVFFVLVAVDAHERYLATQARLSVAVFWGAVGLGFASHLTFFHAYAGLLVWSIYASHRRGGEGEWRGVATLHAIPLLFLGVFYVVYIRHLRVAGAEPAGLLSVLRETCAVLAGTSPVSGEAWIGAALVSGVTAAGLGLVWRIDRGFFLFALVATLLAPAAMVLLEMRGALFEPRFFPRYFLVSMTVILLLFAWMSGDAYHRGALRAAVVGTLIAFFVTGNVWQVMSFLRGGRGHYRDAVVYLAQHTTGADIHVSSNSDFRTSRLLTFYRRYLPPDKRMTFYSMRAPAAAEWRIVEDVERRSVMPSEIVDGRGQHFRAVRQFPFYGLSGAQWTLYRRVADGPALSRPQSP